MDKKICSKCNKERELSDFAKNNTKSDGLHPSCKICKREYDKIYRLKNKTKIDKRVKKWHSDNREHLLDYKKEHYRDNYDKYRELGKTYYEENKETITQQNKFWAENNPDKVVESKKKYKINNKDKMNKYEREKRNSDPVYRLKNNMRCLVNSSIKNQGYNKKSKTHEILGCSYESLKERLENNPYGFIIDDPNMDIDHVIPLSSASNERELLKLCQADNLQLLPSEYNRNIKKDKIFNRDHFETWMRKVHLLD